MNADSRRYDHMLKIYSNYSYEDKFMNCNLPSIAFLLIRQTEPVELPGRSLVRPILESRDQLGWSQVFDFL